MRPQPLPSDLTDARWALLEPLLPKPKPLGRTRENDPRRVLDAIPYRDRDGLTWRASPHDFPRWRAAHDDLIKWRGDGTRATVKAAEIGGPHGSDGGKRLNGRERHIVVDTPGLVLAVTATAAAADDGTAAPAVPRKLTEEAFPRLEKSWADNEYRGHSLDAWMTEHGWYVIEIGGRPEGTEGSRVIEWRRVAERAFARLGRCRIHGRDHERETRSSEARVRIGMVRLALRRRAGEKYEAPSRYPRPARQAAA